MSDTSKSALSALKRLQEEARLQGIEECGRAVIAALASVGFQFEAPAAEAKPKAQPPKPKRKRRSSAGVRPGSIVALIGSAVQDHPGNRGHQLLAILAMSGHVINERTMRTALRRLRLKGLIEQRQNGGWYLTEEGKR